MRKKPGKKGIAERFHPSANPSWPSTIPAQMISDYMAEVQAMGLNPQKDSGKHRKELVKKMDGLLKNAGINQRGLREAVLRRMLQWVQLSRYSYTAQQGIQRDVEFAVDSVRSLNEKEYGKAELDSLAREVGVALKAAKRKKTQFSDPSDYLYYVLSTLSNARDSPTYSEWKERADREDFMLSTELGNAEATSSAQPTQ